jgi:FlaA1/EpsC-like NDP-sugar epimerase
VHRIAGGRPVSDDLELTGRRALVTGGTQGIGQALVSRSRELSRSLLKFAERDGTASYPQFTAAQGIPT